MRTRRRLEVTVAGRWYLALTIVLGVVALSSGNNGIYLIESLLLAGLILSGVLSERSVSGIRCEFHRGPALAGVPSEDWVIVHNTRKHPLFCIEIGEWRDKRFHRIAYVDTLAPGTHCRVKAGIVHPLRGKHAWDGFAVATRYPFGFARKMKIVYSPGNRIVWPGLLNATKDRNSHSHTEQSVRHGSEFSEGEIRPFTQDDDPRTIVWTLSARGMGPMVRVRRAEKKEPEARIDLRQEPGEVFETQLKKAAQAFLVDEQEQSGNLLLVTQGGNRRLRGRKNCLDRLALAEAEGEPSRTPLRRVHS